MTVGVPTFPADAVFAACPTGPVVGPRRVRLRTTLRVDDPVPAGKALAVWVVDLLSHEAAAKADGVWCLADVFDTLLFEAAALDAADPVCRPPVLSLTAGRFVGLPGRPKVFDLDLAEDVDEIPPGWLETRVFNLRTLWNLCLERAEKWTPPPPSSGPTPTPRA